MTVNSNSQLLASATVSPDTVTSAGASQVAVHVTSIKDSQLFNVLVRVSAMKTTITGGTTV